MTYVDEQQPPAREGARLSAREMLAYGSPSLSIALLGLTFYVYLPKFYVDELGMSLSFLGAVILGSRVLDAFTDPAIGRWSDSLRSSWGRRRPFILFGLPVLLASFWMLLNPVLHQALAVEAFSFAALTFGFFIFWSMVSIPYEALGAELSQHFDERNRLFSVRTAFFIVGTLLAAVLPELVALSFPDAFERYAILSLIYLPITLVLFGWCIGATRERRGSKDSFVRDSGSLREALRNRPFRLLLSSYLISGFGASLPATLIFFYIEHVLGVAQGGFYLLLYFIVGFICSPIWPWAAARWGKKQAWIGSIVMNTGAFAGVLLLGKGDALWYGVLVSASGIGLTGTMALPISMQADVIDCDEIQSGSRREGLFVGLWSVAKKLSEALGAGITFPLLAWAGYQAGTPPQGATLTMLIFLYAGLPCICNVLSIVALWGYDLDRSTYERIRFGSPRNQKANDLQDADS